MPSDLDLRAGYRRAAKVYDTPLNNRSLISLRAATTGLCWKQTTRTGDTGNHQEPHHSDHSR